MNNFSSSFLLLLLLSHVFPLSSLCMRRLQDGRTDKEKEPSMEFLDTSLVESHREVQRKELHEVHSGPNPISNSVPRCKLKTKLRKTP